MLFRSPITLAILSGSRRVPPFGLQGGGPGRCGRNALLRADGSLQELGGSAQVVMQPGDQFVLETPGGGGWGVEAAPASFTDSAHTDSAQLTPAGPTGARPGQQEAPAGPGRAGGDAEAPSAAPEAGSGDPGAAAALDRSRAETGSQAGAPAGEP